MVKLAIESDTEYTIKLCGHEIQKILDLISDHVKKTDGKVRRSWVKRSVVQAIVVDGGDASEIPQLEQIIEALQGAEEFESWRDWADADPMDLLSDMYRASLEDHNGR